MGEHLRMGSGESGEFSNSDGIRAINKVSGCYCRLGAEDKFWFPSDVGAEETVIVLRESCYPIEVSY